MLKDLIKTYLSTCGMKPSEIHLTLWRYGQIKQHFESDLIKPAEPVQVTASSYLAGTYEGVKIIVHI